MTSIQAGLVIEKKHFLLTLYTQCDRLISPNITLRLAGFPKVSQKTFPDCWRKMFCRQDVIPVT